MVDSIRSTDETPLDLLDHQIRTCLEELIGEQADKSNLRILFVFDEGSRMIEANTFSYFIKSTQAFPKEVSSFKVFCVITDRNPKLTKMGVSGKKAFAPFTLVQSLDA